MKNFTHKYTRRKRNHNYHAPGVYHIILKKAPAAPSFGEVSGNPAIPPGQPGCAYIKRSRLGKVINHIIYNFQFRYPVIELYQFMVMPDHVHILIHVKEHTKAHLSYYIGCLKNQVVDEYNKKLRYDYCPHTAIGATRQSYSCPTVKAEEIFEANYTDKPIYSHQNLDIWYRYIAENPHRLAMRRQRPDFFRRVRDIDIEGERMQAYGNLFLLRNPYKEAVIVRSFYDEVKKEELYNDWLDAIEKEGVLVSAFVSPDEKDMRKLAEELEAPIILITDQPFPDRYKPALHDFGQCSKGKLLILAPAAPWPEQRRRHRCQRMNLLAQRMSTPLSAQPS